jgi:SH3-like domain-containing protein
MLVKVTQDYVAQYADPIAALAGQELLVCQQDDEYPCWWWCRGPDGREGWVPESFLRFKDGKEILLRDYDATELSACVGEVLEVHEQVDGWARATNSEGRAGWLPLKHVATID